ncbi:putative reverse transcriptase domain-containing protein [Tanacetum coccineum]
MLSGRHPMPIFLLMVKFDGNYPRRFLQFRNTTRGRISPIAPRKVENSGNQNHANYVLSATNPILDELLKEFGYELLDNTVVDKEGDCNPTRDIEEVKFDGNYPRWFFKDNVSTVWKDDRRSDKSYSCERSGKVGKSTSVFGYELLDNIVLDKEGDRNPTRDIEEIERILAKYHQSFFTEIKVKFDGNYPRWFFKEDVMYGITPRVLDLIMLDYEDSTVTYTAVSSLYEDSSDMGSPGVEGPPMMPEDPHAYVVAIFQAPPSPDYMPGPKEPKQAPPSLVYLPYVPDPVYPEYMPPEDDVLPAEEQSLPAAASPTTELPGYILESDPEEDDEDDPKEDPADYPADRGDDRDDEESSNDDDDVGDEVYEGGGGALSPADPAVVFLVVQETIRWVTLLPLPIPSPPPNSPTYIEAPLGFRAAGIRQRDTTPSPVHETKILEICLPLRKRPCRTAPTPRYEVGESSAAGFVDMVDAAPGCLMSSELGYGITDTWDDLLGAIQEIAPTPGGQSEGGGRKSYELVATVDQEDGIMYSLLEDAREDRSLLRGQVNMLFRDMPYHRRTTLLMEEKARVSRLQRHCQQSGDYRVAAAISETGSDYRDAGSGSSKTETAYRGTKTDEEVTGLDERNVMQTEYGDDSHTSGTGVRRNERVVRECTYQDFMKCQPLYFKGTEGVVELTQWFERMETVFRISNCSVENQIKFSTCTLLAGALTWWNSHVMTVGHDVAYAMTWTDLKKKMTDKYCPRNEMKKLEAELWNLKVKGTDVLGYNQRFQELALLCVRMFPEESDKIERYVGGLPDMIHSSVVASKPKTMQEAIEMATELMDKKISTLAKRLADCRGRSGDKKNHGNGEVKKLLVTSVESRTLQEGMYKREKKMGNQVGNAGFSVVYAEGHADKPRREHRYGSQIDITPNALDHDYVVELADGRIDFIFTVNTFISLRCSGNITRIMRRTLKIILVFTVCETQVYWNSVLMRFIDDLMALDSIVHFWFLVVGGWSGLPPFQYRLTRSERDDRMSLSPWIVKHRIL